MNKIGFENFRQFTNFTPVEYSNITYLVGKNNSGKSTLVKAILLIVSALKRKKHDYIDFMMYDDILINIATFKRALYNHGSTLRSFDEQQITLHFSFGDFNVDLEILEKSDSSQLGTLDYFNINDSRTNIEIEIISKHLSIIFNPPKEGNEPKTNNIFLLEKELSLLSKQIASLDANKASREYINLNHERSKLKAKIKLEKEQISKEKASKPDSYWKVSDYYFGKDVDLHEIFYDALVYYEKEYRHEFEKSQNNKKTKDNFADLRAFYHNKKDIDDLIDRFFSQINALNLNYIGSNIGKQSAIYSANSSNNPLAKAISDYSKLGIKASDTANRYVIRWMKEFEIGDDYKIDIIAGEVYTVKIKKGEEWFHLSDKGTGSIQLMLILFRIAAIIRNRKKNLSEIELAVAETEENKDFQPYKRAFASDFGFKTNGTEKINPLVIVEEPEINLHPAFQSRLCDFFLDVHLRFHIDFIIETHSEYMIRRSQVIVSEKDYASKLGDNPFSVLYFYKEKKSVDVFKYEEDGTFDRDFGPGFFDEASASTMQLLRLKRKKRLENNEDLRR